MEIGSEAKDRGLVRMTTLWSRWTHDSGGLAACRGGGAVVSVVARQIQRRMLGEMGPPHQRVLALPARRHATPTALSLLTPFDELIVSLTCPQLVTRSA
jgi:hypothetical protein